jgi:hypothetical protein
MMSITRKHYGWRTKLETGNVQLLTTRAIMLEIGNALAKIQHRRAALALLDSLEEDPSVEIVPLSEEICGRALQIYRERMDKEWGMTDCISFIVMRDRGLTAALTTDEHFEQAGFRAILREDQPHL